MLAASQHLSMRPSSQYRVSAGHRSAGAWNIHTDDVLFQHNEVHGVRIREHLEPGDGMAFDADLGTRNTRFIANYSHDNGGGLMLFCGSDGLGHPGTVAGVLVENNLSVNDGRRIILVQDVDDAVVRNNLVITSRPSLVTPLIENVQYPMKNAVQLRGQPLYPCSRAGRPVPDQEQRSQLCGHDVGGNTYAGYGTGPDFPRDQYVRDGKADRFIPPTSQDPNAQITAWIASSGFGKHKHQARPAD